MCDYITLQSYRGNSTLIVDQNNEVRGVVRGPDHERIAECMCRQLNSGEHDEAELWVDLGESGA